MRRILLILVSLNLTVFGGPRVPRALPEGVILEKDLPYLAPGRGERLDLYRPVSRAAGKGSPAVVIIHGGGWVGGDKGADREFVTGTALAKAGYVGASINYRLEGRDRWPQNLHDCKNAVRWLRVNADRLGVDPERIGVIGGSAGGHLAMMVAYTAGHPGLDPGALYAGVSDKVSACVNMYGIANLVTRRKTDRDGTPNGPPAGHALFPESRESAPAKWKLASPVTHVTAASPPTLILHGTRDTTVDRDQSVELARVLKAAGVEHRLIMVEGANHAWALRTKDFNHTGDVIAFFDQHLK